MINSSKEKLAKYRKKRAIDGLVYFSCQVTPEIKEKLQILLKKLRQRTNHRKL